MRNRSGSVLAGFAALLAATTVATATSPADQSGALVVSGLICDTREQAERFVRILRDDVEEALGTVNTEAGIPDACVVATYGFVPGQTVSEIERDGRIVTVVEVRVLAVATSGGLRMIEPKVFYSIKPTGDRIA